jgi:hypothetical protein
MSTKQESTSQSSVSYINAPGFIDRLQSSINVNKFCLSIANNPKISKQIINKLSSIGIDE